MARPRDYALEYARRISSGFARGLTRAQARGHPGPGQPFASGYEPRPYERRLEEGLKMVREGRSVPRAAKAIDEPPQRLRDYLARTGVGEKRQGRWVVGQDDRIREMLIYSRGKHARPSLDLDNARRGGAYMSTVGQALDSNDPEPLEPFNGEGVTDTEGRFHPFETRINVLYRLNVDRAEPYEQTYRIVAKAS